MSTDTLVVGGVVLIVAVLGWVIARFVIRTLAFVMKVTILVALGLLIGRLVGTTYTHAFDILWWWKGLALSALLLVGGWLGS